MARIPVSQGYNPGQYTYIPKSKQSRTSTDEAHAWVDNAFSARDRFIPVNARGSSKPKYRSPIHKVPNEFYTHESAWIMDMRNSQYLYLATTPDSTEESFSVSMYSESPVGSDIPVNGFSSMGARKLNTSFQVDQSYLPDGYRTVEQYIDKLVAMIYPKYSSSQYVNPPECCFNLVGLKIIGICDSLSVSWGSTVRSGSLDSAKVSISIVETKRSL